MLSPKTSCLLLCTLLLTLAATAQEPAPPAPATQTQEQKKQEPVQPEKAPKPATDPTPNPEMKTTETPSQSAQPSDQKAANASDQKADQKPGKPEPPRKGGIQAVGDPSAEAEKGSISNLGTDVPAVRQRIESALSNDPSLRGMAFTLNVTDDTIEITGVANSGRDRTAARRIVQSFAGNMRVRDRITVAGAAPPSAPQPAAPNGTTDKTDRPSTEADANADPLAKPESDEQSPQKKANKPKKDPPKDGDQSPDPRR